MKCGSGDRGVTLLETMLSVTIALVGVFGMGQLVFQVSAASKNQGTETTRAVVYAQDKIEKLLSLSSVPTATGQPNFASCTQAASSQPSECNTTGVATSGWTTGLLAGGSTSPLQAFCPNSGANVAYMDFLDPTGVQIDACANPSKVVAYVRQWQITDLTASTTPAAFSGGPILKQITVAVYSLSAVNTNGGKPVVIVTSTVSNPN
jgi:Tfp pilus assembly protein PilV